MKLHKFIRRICAAAVAAALTLSLCTPVLAEGAAALPAAEPGTSQLDETGDVRIDLAHFPDDHFIAYVELRCDKDGDGTLSQAELDGVTELYVDHAKIKDLTGIELFPNLKKLDCKNNNLTCLDVSQNTNLTVLYCESNQLTSLDVSNNPALTYLNCSYNQLTSLDLIQNTALTKLDCALNPLTSLDVSNNPALTYLNCSYNQLTGLDLSKNIALTKLECYENQLTRLDLRNNPMLGTLHCRDNQLTSLDLSQNTVLTVLTCQGNQLTSLDLSKNTALTILGCSGNKRSLELSDSGRFDLSTLPGFDPDRAVWPEGVTVENGAAARRCGTSRVRLRRQTHVRRASRASRPLRLRASRGSRSALRRRSTCC